MNSNLDRGREKQQELRRSDENKINKELMEKAREAQKRRREEDHEYRKFWKDHYKTWQRAGIERKKWLQENNPEWVEQQRKNAANGGKAGKGLICITNGEENRKIRPGVGIPEGWRRGLTRKPKG